ncbi:DUF305 domain-containing protein [Deinococcus sp. Leaf326]|jgi:uncharacterized protein (DUF305 family)|uniref:DUF305 domain-containing protein n=1 Tax=Deinococcus sp. Leaf326 TaxID=1736338 RepID=UPI0006F5794C|nr:DUF305 domain-containing protein [Deinococcus sp. Leaf326]KQR35121.1 hypothetical protein ASF71_16180 [Deinococcus sp. Leaf326]
MTNLRQISKPAGVLLVLTTTVLLTGAALAQGMAGMDHSNMPGMGSSTSSMKMEKMDLSALAKLQGKAFDRAFLSMMAPHHQMAVDMAKAVLPVSKDATVKAWANAVIKDQTQEITQMNTILKGMGGVNNAMANTMKSSMSGMGDMIKKSKTPDVAFVQGMLPHHASAIDMANLALQQGQDARVLSLSKAIITAQATEMLDYRTWLKKRGL